MAFWESRYPAFMIPFIPILIEIKKKGDISYRRECMIPNSDWATCNSNTDYGIDFSYENHNFKYYMYPNENVADVYLLDKSWNYIETGNESEDNHISYYCMDFDDPYEKTEKDFKNLLAKLIKKYNQT